MASLNLWRRVAAPMASNGRMWKMDCRTFSSGVDRSAPIKVEKESSAPSKAEKGKVEKRKVFQKLKSLTVETIDLILREEEKKGVYVTQTDLVSWAKRLAKNKNKSENALEIFRWMDKKKMEFSPSELAVYVDLIAEVKGYPAAHAYFRKVDPTFKEWEPNPKNWPAHMKLVERLIDIEDKSSLKNLVFIYPSLDLANKGN